MYFLGKKFLIFLFSLWCVVTGTFFLMHAIPGDPFIGERPIPEEVLRSLYTYYGLDQPLWKQYVLYLKSAISFDFGSSIVYYGRTVRDFIQDTFPISALLGLQALLLAIPSGILLGTWAALKRTEWQDHFSM